MRKTKTVEKVPFLAPDVQTAVIPSPTDGWDAISPLAEMDPKRAAILNNFVPRPGYVELRPGYRAWALCHDGSPAPPVESLIVWRGPASEKMFSACDSVIHDVSSYGNTTDVQSSLSNSRWYYTNFTPTGGTTVIQLVNAADRLRQFNGTVWTVEGTDFNITGAAPWTNTTNVANIAIGKRRLWYVLNNSSVIAFMPTDAIQGPIAGTLDFGALWDKGGFLVAAMSWTIDGGSGPQDYMAFISSRGQITLYSGIDPTDAANWALVGTFAIAPPIGRRCLTKVGSDIAIITQQGVLPISQVLPFDPSADRSVAITARIQNAMSQSALLASNNYGWEFSTFPAQTLAILNVPLQENKQQVQYVMNTLTGAWCQFLNYNGNCFTIYQDNLYFGGNDGIVYQGYYGDSDNNAAIAGDMQCAFNWFQQPGRTKRMTMIQPLLTVSGTLTPFLAVDADFQTSTTQAPISFVAGGSKWDSAIWDADIWPSTTVNYTQWLSIQGLGHALAVRMRVNLLPHAAGLAGEFDFGQFDNALFDSGVSAIPITLQINAFNSIMEAGGAI